MDSLRILLVDDHVLFRRGVAALIKARTHWRVVGEANDGVEAITLARQRLPDVILMDIHMPRQDGLETVKILLQEMPWLKIIMLTVSEAEHDLFKALKHGAHGYLLKNLEPEQLYTMLEDVRHGEAVISGAMAAKVLEEWDQSSQNQAEQIPEAGLTPREIEVLEQVATGATNRAIGQILGISENTVKIHLRNILEKLDVQNRVQAAVKAVNDGFVEEELHT
jgi:DNA-binding NarL/FixJ family response regulator